MATYRVDAPDGHTYRIEGPENANEADIIRAVQAQYPYAQSSTAELKQQPRAPLTMGDVGRGGLASLTGSLGAIASSFGAETAPARGLRSFASEVQSGMSPARQEEMRRREELTKRAEGQGIGSEIMSGFGAVAEAPIESIASGIASSIPAIVAGSAALLASAPLAIAGTVALITKLAVGALQGAGETKGNIFDTITEKLMQEKGMSRAEAEAQAIKAQEYISANAPGIMGSAAAGMLDSVTGVESIFGKAAKAKSATRPLTQPGVLGTAGKVAIQEAIPEGIQGGVGQVAQNVALQNAGIDTATFSGVAGAAARDSLMGALTGAAVSPLQLSQLRKEYEGDKQRRLNEEQEKIDVEVRKEEEILRKEQEVKAAEDRVKEEEILAEPPIRVPSPINVHPIRNPLGNVAKEDLQGEGIDPFLSQHIDEYRKSAGLPPVENYSIEDIIGSMPGVNPAEEQNQIDIILNSRTGYQGERLTAQDVMDQAAAKQVDKDEALGDFLARTTGQKDPKSMSQSQLFAAFKSIQALPEGEPLETGTNAVKFDDKQYKAAINGLDKIVSEEPILVGDALKNIKLSTGLTEDAYAESILDEAVRRGDVDRRGDKINAPTTAETLPEGYSIQEGSFERGERPEGFQIQMGEEVLPEVYDTQEAADKKLEEVTKVRGQMVKDINNQITQRQNDLVKSQENLTKMQTAGQQGTLAYNKANAKLIRQQRATTDNIARLNEQLARVDPESKPLSVVKPKAKKVKGRGFTLFKDQKAVKFFKTRPEAEEAILGGLEETALQDLTKTKGRRTLKTKAEQEIARRAAPKEEVKPEPKPEFESTLRELLIRFGLKNVALNIEKDMATDGEYAKSVIRIALDSANPVRTLRHESVHALKELGFFKPNQWKALENMAKKEWINTYLKRRNINGEPLETGQQSRYDAYMDVYKGDQDAIIEEAIADAFANFDATRAPVGMVRAILRNLKLFFEALRNSLNGAGFLTYEDVFGKVEASQLRTQIYEKRLYQKLSGRKADDIGYEEAIIAQSSEGSGRARPSVVFSEQSSGRDEPRAEVTETPAVRETGREPAKGVKLSLRDTDQFKRWFGKSKIVNEDGSPKVMYHGTVYDFAKFRPGMKIDSRRAFFVTDDPKFAEDFAQNFTTGDGFGSNIMPLYVNAENPFDYENPAHVDKIKGMDNVNPNLAYIERGSWQGIEDPLVQNAIQKAGFDSFYVMEGGRKNLGVFNPEQLKSAIGNVGTFDRYNPDIRYNLRESIDPAIRDSVDRITTAREEKGFVERILSAISPESFSSFRAKALNRYNRLSDYDQELVRQRGGAKLMADASAESAALMSDLGAGLTASALGVHDRVGGIPVYKNGVATVSNLNNTVKGPVSIFAPLAKYGNPYIYQLYQFWAGAKRGKRLLKDGKEEVYTPAMLNHAKKLEQQYPEFVTIQKEWIKFNNGLVEFLVDTGVLSKDRAEEFTRYSDYVPFYRQFDGERTIGPNLFGSISGVKGPKGIKGSKAPLADFLETIVRNTQSSIQMGIKNVAAQRARDVAVSIGMAMRLNQPSTDLSVFTVLENGKLAYYQSSDDLFINAIKSLNMPDIPFIGILSAPANLLRNLVTKDPGFMLANMVRDSMSAYVTSGSDLKPVISTIKNFVGAIAGTSPEYTALLNAGLIGGYDFSQNVKQSGKTMEEALRIKAGIRNKMDYATGVWQALEKGTTASDAATRMEIYKNTLARTGNEAEALFRAMEVLNFNRKGSSAVVRILTAAVPFLNARVQGLDVLYRAAAGKGSGDVKEIQRRFFARGMTMFALSCLYWGLTHDDEEYKKQEQETRDNYWLIPSMGVKIPIPFEVGILFKVIPERIMGYAFGSDTGKDFAKSMGRQLTTTLMFNPIPQTFLPLVETVTNYSFFTKRDIVPEGLQDVANRYQIGPGTTLTAQLIGEGTGLSPIQIDHLWKGYTGTMGMYAADVLDMILDLNGDSPKVSKRIDQLPIIKRFAIDPEARGTVTAYYEMKNAVDEVTRTVNLLERTGKFTDMGEYMQDNMKLLASKDYIQDLEKQMKELREMKNLIRSSGMTGDQKLDAITDISKMENQLTSNMRELKKLVGE